MGILEKSVINFYNCDYKKRMTVGSILRKTGQLAGEDYIRQGLGHQYLWDKGYVFLVSRVSMAVKRMPVEMEEIEISTWECGREGVLFLRGFKIEGDKGGYLEGESGWIVVSPCSRKVIRPSKFPWQMEQMWRSPMEEPIGKKLCKNRVSNRENSEDRYIYKVGVSDLDANGHMNNGRYGDLSCNGLSIEEYGRDIKNYRINFLNEVKYGAELIISKRCILQEDDMRQRIVIEGESEGKLRFESEYILE